MSTFIKTLQLVLAGRKRIDGLTTKSLIYVTDGNGKPVEFPISQKDFWKVLRLQTLIVRELRTRGNFVAETVGRMKLGIEQDALKTMSQSMVIEEDTARRVMMLEQLITEVVHEAVSSERERFNAKYYAHSVQGLMWRLV